MALNVTFFNCLSLLDQMGIVNRHGEYITTVRENDKIINLYLLDDSFAEVYFHEECTKVKSVNVITRDEKRMEFYVNQVNISDLYQPKI